MSKAKRTGKTLNLNPMTASRKDLVTVGFTAEEADAMVYMRRVLPFDLDSKTPKYDARKLWERIGKPWGRFNMWADQYIKPLLESFAQKSTADSEMNSAGKAALIEIITRQIPTGKRGKPRTDYLLSRDVAARIAMQVNTPEGDKVRTYFTAMESAFYKLQARNQHRDLTLEDNLLTHSLIKRAKGEREQALEWECDIKNRCTEILTGITATAWRGFLADGRGIRDVLNIEDMAKYDRAYSMYVGCIVGGQLRKVADSIVMGMYANNIDPTSYGYNDKF